MLRLLFESAKIHICETQRIADLAIADLEMRGAALRESWVLECQSISPDFGGAALVDQNWNLLSLNSGLEVFFLPQQYKSLLAAMERGKNKPRQGDWYKFHANFHCHCLEKASFEELLTVLKERRNFYEALESQAFSDLEKALERI